VFTILGHSGGHSRRSFALQRLAFLVCDSSHVLPVERRSMSRCCAPNLVNTNELTLNSSDQCNRDQRNARLLNIPWPSILRTATVRTLLASLSQDAILKIARMALGERHFGADCTRLLTLPVTSIAQLRRTLCAFQGY
jgi:hypothetical protein